MLNRNHVMTAVVFAALGAAAPSFASSTYDFGPLNGSSVGTGGVADGSAVSQSVTSSDGANTATFTQANAATADYGFYFASNNNIFSNIGGGSGTILTSGGYGATTLTGATASITISFASAVNSISLNWGNTDASFAPNGGDLLTATVGNTTVATSTGAFNPNGDIYAEGAFSYANAAGFNSITLTSTDAAGVEDLAIGDLATSNVAPVPLPASIWLLAGGLAALGFKRRSATI